MKYSQTSLCVLLLSLMSLSACNNSDSATTSVESSSTTPSSLCSEAWFKQVEQQVMSGDGQGHGPDLGSEEWQSVIEFKLGVRGNSDVPQRNTPQWCEFIDAKLLASK
ncbi:hypothetical protein [Shewanella gaetbuli]